MNGYRLKRWMVALSVGLTLAFAAGAMFGQGTSGSVAGAVTDTTGAEVPGATVTLGNAVSGFTRTVTSDASGKFQFFNLPFSPYTLTVKMKGFQATSKVVQVSSAVPMSVTVPLAVGVTDTTITVEAPVDLVENDSTAHTDIDRSTMDRLPVESASSGLSSIITLASPGISADSNGQMHGLGDHAENSFSIDGQPITDQQSKVFSNQVPSAAVQSLEVIEGAPPAEYGDKTSLVIKATTRSGQGVTTPTGSVTLSFGSFGSSNAAFDVAYGGKSWGNFIAANGLQTGRFLDAPEFAVMHDKGNEENFFDRFDTQLTQKDSIHTNVQYTRSWFQTPNTFDTEFVERQTGQTAGIADQVSKIGTIDFAPTYTRAINDQQVFNFGPYIRRDSYNYYPSANPLNDLGPPNLQQESVAQQRSLTNLGAHADLTYAHGVHNAKAGVVYGQTFLREHDQIGLVSATLNSPCVDGSGNPLPGFMNTTQCTKAGDFVNPGYVPVLAPYDFTRGGGYYAWFGHTDVKQLAMYAQDQITTGPWLFNVGVRGDFYNGLAIQRQAEPRLGASYSVKKTGSVLRLSYARTQETPFNENLVLSSQGCLDPVLNAVFSTLGTCVPAAFNPGFRNEFHAGFEQSAGHHLVFSGEYIWKYTHNGYDFSVLGATPITFPIEWHNSKIPGYTLSGTLTPVKGFSARVNMSSVAARFFNPQIGGVGATPGAPGGYPFRIDHDEKFNQTTHLEYAAPFRKSLYYSFNWRYDSGLVAGSVPCYGVADPNSACGPYSITIAGRPGIDLSGLTNDQEFQAGMVCNGVKATPYSGFTQCLASQLTSKLVKIPAANTEDDDKNPQRIQPRNLFDMAVGEDNLVHFHANRYKIGARVTAINVTNKYALYNFLSTFSGTHYVSPRSVTAEVSFHF
jgi:hypothetical protein